MKRQIQLTFWWVEVVVVVGHAGGDGGEPGGGRRDAGSPVPGRRAHTLTIAKIILATYCTKSEHFLDLEQETDKSVYFSQSTFSQDIYHNYQ